MPPYWKTLKKENANLSILQTFSRTYALCKACSICLHDEKRSSNLKIIISQPFIGCLIISLSIGNKGMTGIVYFTFVK